MTFLRQFSSFLIASLVACSLGLTGCGSKYHPVTGEIVFPDGTPVKGLAGGQIVFNKVGSGGGEAAAAGTSASSPIDADGKFTLGTEAVADGAPAGDYNAVISPPQPTGDEQIPKVIDVKYTRPGGLAETFTVKAGTKNHFKVKVDPAK